MEEPAAFTYKDGGYCLVGVEDSNLMGYYAMSVIKVADVSENRTAIILGSRNPSGIIPLFDY
jgi:hypothetical protein